MADVCRKIGISEQIFYRRKMKFQTMVGEVRRLVAGLIMDKQMLLRVSAE